MLENEISSFMERPENCMFPVKDHGSFLSKIYFQFF